MLMREAASELTIAPESVDRERGVILSERRARDTYQLRSLIRQLAFHMPGMTVANRIPIGAETVIRTAAARLAMITLGEGLKMIPRGTHDWSSFLTPDELEQYLLNAGLKVSDRRGLGFSPARGFVLSDGLPPNYLMAATPAL